MTNRAKATTAALAAILLAAGDMTAQNTQLMTATKANDYALAYTLPETALDITLEAEITVRKPGEFYRYARKYLNIDDPIAAESRTATLKSAVVTTRGVRPADAVPYAMQLKNGFAAFVMLSAEGFPLAINTEQTAPAETVTLPEPKEAAPTALETPAARQVISQEMLQSQSVAKRAELAATAIFDLRQSRSELISGQADTMPPDGKSLQLMLDNLEAQEQALLAMFVGTTKTSTVVTTVSVTPDDDISRKVIARLSPLEGFVGPDNLAGDPVYLSVKVTSRGEMPVNEKGETIPFPKNGVAYCIPGEAEVTVSYDGRDFYRADREFAQFGIDYGLAPSLLTDRKNPRFMIFDPATGALLSSGTDQQ